MFFEPTTVYSDDQVAIAYVKDLKYHGKTKSINTKNNSNKIYYCTQIGDLEIFTYKWNGCWSIHRIHSNKHVFLHI